MKFKLFYFITAGLIAFSLSALAQTATSSRLIAQANYSSPGSSFPFSLTHYYVYSGTRGGDLNHTLKYDTTLGTSAHYVAGGPTSPASGRNIQSFDANNNIVINVGQFYNTSKTYQSIDSIFYTYDSHNNLLTELDYTWDNSIPGWRNNTKQLYSYDAANRILSQVNQSWSTASGAWGNTQADSFAYTATGKLATHTTLYWNTSWALNTILLYSYDAADNNTAIVTQQYRSGSWTNTTAQYMGYSTANNLLVSINTNWDSTTGAWDSSTKDTYTYNPVHDRLTDLTQSYTAGVGWINQGNENIIYDLNHNVLIDISQYWVTASHSFTNNGRKTFTYNSFNQPLTEISSSWTSGAWVDDMEYDYYYQTYTTGVNNLKPTINNIVVYPNPALQVLYVSIKADQPQASTIRITDISGRLLYQTTAADSQDLVTVPVSQLSAGNYFVTVGNKDGEVTKGFVVGR